MSGGVVIGAMTPRSSRSPFNRGPLVARGPDGTIFRLHDRALISADDWRELLGSGHALPHPETALSSGAALWVLRAPFKRRDRALRDLRCRGVLLCPHTIDGDAWMCLVDENTPAGAAAELRDLWQQEAAEQARMYACAGDWPGALGEAELAQAVGRGLDPDSLAMLHLVYERLGRVTAAAGLVVMARRSRGVPFAARLLEMRARLGLRHPA